MKIFEKAVLLIQKEASDSITLKSLKIFLIQGLGLCLTFGVNLWLAKLLDTKGYGYYSYLTTIINLLSTIACLSFSGILVRELPVYQSQGKIGSMLGLLQFTFLTSLACSAFLGVLFYISNFLQFLPWNLSPLIALIVALAIPVSSTLLIRQFALNGLNKSIQSQIGNFILKPGFQLIYIIIALAISFNHIQELSIIIYSLSLLTTFLIIEFIFKTSLPVHFKEYIPTTNYKIWIKISTVMLGFKIIDSLYLNSEVLLLSYLRNENEVGIFSMAKKLSNLVSFGMIALNVVLTPKIALLISENRLNELQYLITKNLRVMITLSIAIVLFLILFSNYIFSFLGINYSKCFIPLLILITGELINVIFGPVIPLLINSKQEKYATIILGITLLLSIFLNLMLTNHFGYIGAAITTVLTTLCWNFLMARRVKRTLGIKSWLN